MAGGLSVAGPTRRWPGGRGQRCRSRSPRRREEGAGFGRKAVTEDPGALCCFPGLHPPQSTVSSRALSQRPGGGSREQDVCRTSHSKGKSPFVLERTTAASRFCPGIGFRSARCSGPSPAPYPVEFYSGVNIVAEALGTGGGRQASAGSRRLRVPFHMMTVEHFSSLQNVITSSLALTLCC